MAGLAQSPAGRALHSFIFLSCGKKTARSVQEALRAQTDRTTIVKAPTYGRQDGAAPERRCSSRTFRYGYLVTT